MCCFNNDHDKSHNIINIKDEKSLKNTGISYENSKTEFEKIFKKTKIIKEKIENEIETLTTAHKTKINEITENYKYQCEYLNEKVEEMKNELNKFLKDINNILLSCENIFKATENYNILNDNYEIKTLFYISEINKSNEKAKIFLKKPIRNINLKLGSSINNSTLFKPDMYNYTYYYFSGLTVPKCISISKNNKKLLISWIMDEFKEIYSIKYCIQIKIDNEEFVYESKDKSFILDKYDEKAIYEIKIRVCVGEFLGEWSETKKFMIRDLDNSYSLFGSGTGLFEAKPLFGSEKVSLFGKTNNNDKEDNSSDKQNKNVGGSLFGNNNNNNLTFKSLFNNNKNEEKEKEKKSLFNNDI